MAHIFLVTSLAADSPITAYKRGDSGTVPVDIAALDADADQRVTLLIDARDCTRVAEAIPAKTEAQARTAAPYVVEDYLAQSVEDCHVALGPDISDTGQRHLTIVDHDGFQKLLNRLSAMGLAITSAFDQAVLLTALPHMQGGRYLAVDDCIIGPSVDNADTIIAADRDMADLLLMPAGENDLCYSADGAENSFDAEVRGTTITALLGALNLADIADYSLLQGQFRPRKSLAEIWQTWRPTAIAAGLGLLSTIGVLAGDALLIDRQIAALDDHRDQLMQQAFPGVRSISHMLQRLGQMQGSARDPFLTLAAATLTEFQAIEGLSLDGLRYDVNQDELALSIYARRFDDVQTLKTRLEAGGLDLREGTTRQAGGEIVSEVKVGWSAR